MKNIIKKFSVVVLALCCVILSSVSAFAASTPCKLQIKDFKEREVYDYSFSADKKLDKDNKVIGVPELGILTVKVSVLNDGTPDMFAYMADNNLKKDGTIILNDTKTGKEIKKINFTGASCVGFEEKYDTELGYYEEVKLYCSSFKVGNFDYDRPADSVYSPDEAENNAVTASAFSTGNIVTICCTVLILIVAAAAVLIIAKKKRKAE